MKTWGMAIAAAVVCGSCGGVAPVAMHRVDAVWVQPEPGEGVVVFVRPGDACARTGPITIVDEHGEYVGESATESQFAVKLPEGDHVFYAWDPVGEIRTHQPLTVNDVAAVSAHVEGHRPGYVLVTTRSGAFDRRKTCSSFGSIELRHVDRNEAQLDDWLRETTPYAPDHAAGQRWLDANAAETKRHVDLGAKKLVTSSP